MSMRSASSAWDCATRAGTSSLPTCTPIEEAVFGPLVRSGGVQ